MGTTLCIVCQKEVKGRSDKKFCSSKCKNVFHLELPKQEKLEEVSETDAILHRNREILAQMIANRNEEKYHQTTLIDLTSKGFVTDYCTGFYLNSQGKMYRYLYEYAWMVHTHQIVRIYKRGMDK